MSGQFELIREIVIVPFDPNWAQQYQAIAELLCTAFGKELFAVHHVGSTAIHGMRAKPIIDVLVEVHDIERVDGLNARFARLGYEPRGEFGIAGRRFFVKNEDGVRSQHIHTFQRSHDAIATHLDFRDYLIAHTDAAAEYAALKDSLAETFRTDIAGYTDGKAHFIKNIVDRAQVERASITRWEL